MIGIAIVTARYGSDATDGPATLARAMAENLLRRGFRVTIFTTCAREAPAWRNEYPAGESLLRGAAIRRFPVRRAEGEWPAEQGPYCPELVQALAAAQPGIDLFIFFSCWHYPTVAGLAAVSKPAVLFPVARDEAPLRRAAMNEVFRRPDALFFLNGAEMELVRERFAPPGAMRLVRFGVEARSGCDEGTFRRRQRLVAPYLLYAGRIEKERGLEAVFDYYAELKREAYVDLVLIGTKKMDLPRLQGLKYLGFVGDDAKLAAFKGALLSLQPSPRASLSWSALESFSQGTPVLANRQNPALREHVQASGGGVLYGDAAEFLEGFRRLYRRPLRRAAMGEKGLEYVKKYYSWDAVIGEIQAGIAEILEIKA